MFETVALFSIFATFAALEWGMFFFFMTWLIFATGYDRNYKRQGSKWIGLMFLGLVGAAYFWHEGTYPSLWAEVKTLSFWKPLIVYLFLGLIYSVLEFFLEVYRSKNYYAKMWDIKSWMVKGQPVSVSDFCSRYSRMYSPVQLDWKIGGTTPVPKINKSILAQCISAWTIFWPFYAASLILFDVLEHVWDWIADLFVSLSGRFVKNIFKDAFKPIGD